MKLKHALAILAFQTALFVSAQLAGISYLWVLLLDVVLLAGWLGLRALTDRTQALVTQGSHMGWVWVGARKGPDGFRDGLLKRGEYVVRVAYSDKKIYLEEPFTEGPFADFVELERQLVHLDEA